MSGILVSLTINPKIKGRDHLRGVDGALEPFSIGDLDPSGSFVQVLDEISLEVIMRELDTITDFVEHLQKKSEFIRSGRLSRALGEENLHAHFARKINDEGYNEFDLDEEITQTENSAIDIDNSYYKKLIDHPQYAAENIADSKY